MNRKQKIIISVTGIFIVMLILVGLTYAYFLTQITGNTKDKSISVTTADLRVVYGDGTQELLTSSTKLVPSSNAINTKDFTVTNTGDRTEYAVLIEDVRVKVAGTENLTTFESNDFKYTLTCTKSDGSSCNGVSSQTILPMSDSILVTNEIDSEDVHTYEITLWYLETNKDQSNDMNKTLEARINIEDPNRINPYLSKPNSLAYNIINSSLNVTKEQEKLGYAQYRSTPLTEPAKELSLEIESSLTPTPDDYTQASGINSYYFRGNVENNYVEFNNMCWRIVRIEGDGSVKLILAKEDLCSSITDEDIASSYIGIATYDDGTMAPGVTYENDGTTSIKYRSNEWYNNKILTVSNQIKQNKICLGDSTTLYDETGNVEEYYGYYKNYVRLIFDKTASLKCEDNEKSKGDYKIYPLTADEVVFAGALYGKSNNSYYLKDNAGRPKQIIDDTGVDVAFYKPDFWWWTSSVSSNSGGCKIFVITQNFEPYIDYLNEEYNFDGNYGGIIGAIRPAISLIADIELASDSGNGTINNPYIIKS